MRTASITDFRKRFSEMVEKGEAIMVTRQGYPLGFFVPWKDKVNLPLELKRKAFLKNAARRKKMYGHIDEKKLLEDFANWRKEQRELRRNTP